MQEAWKPIPGYEDKYEASNLGAIRSVARTTTTSGGRTRKVPSKDFLARTLNRRYAIVSLSDNGAVKTISVHRLVAITFIPNPNSMPEINHIDGDKFNNAASNLEWVTRAQNNDHAISTGLKPPVLGSQHGMSKLDEHKVLQIRQLLSIGIVGNELAKRFGVSKYTISLIKRGKTWRHV